MSSTTSEPRRRRRLTMAVKESMRELSIQLSLLNHRVKDVDLDCLDLVGRHGPMSASELAKRAGLHPATMTGILDRLERGGWIARERHPSDRRAVAIRVLRDRGGELFRLYAGMNASMDDICAGYTDAELELRVGDRKRLCSLRSSGGLDRFVADECPVAVPASGLHQLAIRPNSERRVDWLGLRSVRLIPMSADKTGRAP